MPERRQGELQAGGVVRADAALSKAELDAQMTELGNRPLGGVGLETTSKRECCVFFSDGTVFKPAWRINMIKTCPEDWTSIDLDIF